MLSSRLKNIQKVLNGFTGINGEPKDAKELYVLKAMWVMLCAEFEGSLKDQVEKYIDSVKKHKNVRDMHVCFLLQNFNSEFEDKGKLNKKIIFGLFNRKRSEIDSKNFLNTKKAIYKSEAVEYLFNSLGIFLVSGESESLRLLDGIASTRDSISHGHTSISITRKQLENNIPIIKNIYFMLKRKLR